MVLEVVLVVLEVVLVVLEVTGPQVSLADFQTRLSLRLDLYSLAPHVVEEAVVEQAVVEEAVEPAPGPPEPPPGPPESALGASEPNQ